MTQTPVPPPVVVVIPENRRALSQAELCEWYATADAPQAVKDAVAILLNHDDGLVAAQAVELLYRHRDAVPTPVIPPARATSPKTTLYVRCRPRKGVTAESAGKILLSVLTTGALPELPTAIYTDDMAVADALAEHYEVIIEARARGDR